MSKRLTKEEFSWRVNEINRARKIFGELTEGNITKAFEAYLEVFEDRETEIFLSSSQLPVIKDQKMKFKDVKCPDCGHFMLFRHVMPNAVGIESQLVCSNKDCDTVLNSEHNLRWWRKALTIKNEEKTEVA